MNGPPKASRQNAVLILGGGAFIVAYTIALLVGLLVYVVPGRDRPSLGPYVSPQLVTSTEGETGLPEIHRSDQHFSITGKRCVSGNSDFGIVSFRTFTRLSPTPAGERSVVSVARELLTVRPEHCQVRALDIVIPEAVTAGVWRLDTVDISLKDGVLRVWSTEDFEVLP